MAALQDFEVDRVFRRLVEADARSLYFAELASRYSKTKQIISGTAFLFSSGAVVSVAAQAPAWLPIAMSLIVAVGSAYSIATGLDRKVLLFARLHGQWNGLSADLERLWSHWFLSDADQLLQNIIIRSREASEAATIDAPVDEALMKKCSARACEVHAAEALAA